MDARGRWALLCVLVVVGCMMVVPIATAADDGYGGSGAQSLQGAHPESPTLEEADEIRIDIHLHENGSATVTVDYRYEIDNENVSESDWEQLRTDIEEQPEPFVETVESNWAELVAEAENETDRSMELSTVTVGTDESHAPRELGHVLFTFEWSSFAHVELNRIEAGDALTGFTIQDNTGLQIHWPEGYILHEEPSPPPGESSEDSVYWDDDGPGFSEGEPQIVLIDNGGDQGSTEEASEDDDRGLLPPWGVVGLVVLLAAVGAAGWWLRDRQLQGTASTDADDPVADDPLTDAPPSPPPELLSNEERVLRLLENRGGRIKQQEVVSELDWTEAKTSQVVSGLREDGEIDVFRIGRENVIALSDDEDGAEPSQEAS